MKSPVAPVLTIALDEASSIVSVVFRWIRSMMQFGPGLSERILSVQGICFSHLGLHSRRVVWGISKDEGSCFKISLINFEVFLSISSLWRLRTENRLLLNSGSTQFTHCIVQNPWGLCYRGLCHPSWHSLQLCLEQPTYPGVASESFHPPCNECRSSIRSPSPSVQSFHSIGTCLGGPLPSLPCQYP